MSDLLDEELARISTIVNQRSGSVTRLEMARVVAELQRRRAEQAAGREHVERVVKEVAREELADLHVINIEEWCGAIARRVADRMSTPDSLLGAVTAERDRWKLRAESLVKLLDNTTIPGVARRLVRLLDDRGHTPKFDREIRVELDDLRLMVGPLW